MIRLDRHVGFTPYPFFVHRYSFFLLHKIQCSLSPAFLYVHFRNCALTRLSHTRQKCSENFLYISTALFCNIALNANIQNFFSKFLSITIYLVRIWPYKNVNEKSHTLSWRSKNGRILMKPAANSDIIFFQSMYLLFAKIKTELNKEISKFYPHCNESTDFTGKRRRFFQVYNSCSC